MIPPKQLRAAKRLTLYTFLLWFNAGYCEQPLVFVSLPDIHCIEPLLTNPVPAETLKNMDFMFSNMAQANPVFTLMPGDLGGQHWYEPSYQPSCAPRGSLSDVIMGCAAKTYPALLSRMAKNGLRSVYVGVGDHEIGDNDWPLGERSEAVPVFKHAFAKYFTQKPNGSSRFSGTLGGVPMRPIGTPYQETSYAFRAGNVLVVAVDEFRQDNPQKIINQRGTVTVSVGKDGHIQWLDSLLGAARRDPSIRHIIVYGHVPVLSPVRGWASSMIFLESQQQSLFWRTLQKHKVDLYLAGEVHATTVIKDPHSTVFQVNHGGGCAGNNGFLVGRVYENRIELELQKSTLSKEGVKSFAPEGVLVIDNSQPEPRFWATGRLLKPIDPSGLIIHYSFDEDISQRAVNHGSFGAEYDGDNQNVEQVENSILGATAWFHHSDNSQFTSPAGITPISGGQPRTVSVWLRTWQGNTEAYLYPSGQSWGLDLQNVHLQNTLFRVFVAHGVLGLQVDKEKKILAQQGAVTLSDTNWHHVAVTFPGGSGALVDDTRFYIDGNQYLPANHLYEPLSTNASVESMSLGGSRDDSSMQGWTGALDDFAIWASALTPPMIKALVNCASTLAYNASDMEALFSLYRKGEGSTVVQGLAWRYSSHLVGNIGQCPRPNLNFIVLDAQGGGVTAMAQ